MKPSRILLTLYYKQFAKKQIFKSNHELSSLLDVEPLKNITHKIKFASNKEEKDEEINATANHNSNLITYFSKPTQETTDHEVTHLFHHHHNPQLQELLWKYGASSAKHITHTHNLHRKLMFEGEPLSSTEIQEYFQVITETMDLSNTRAITTETVAYAYNYLRQPTHKKEQYTTIKTNTPIEPNKDLHQLVNSTYFNPYKLFALNFQLLLSTPQITIDTFQELTSVLNQIYSATYELARNRSPLVFADLNETPKVSKHTDKLGDTTIQITYQPVSQTEAKNRFIELFNSPPAAVKELFLHNSNLEKQALKAYLGH